jgi:hypothetical protein
MRRWRSALLFAVGLFLLAPLATAVDGDPRVVILRPERTDPELDRALIYLEGELTAAGFAVTIVAVSEPVTPKVLREVGEEREAFATLTVLRSNGNTTADVWIGDRVTGKTSVRTLATTASERSGRILALRAVDLLKTSLAEADQQPTPPPEIVGVAPASEVPREVRVFAERSPPRASLRVHAAGLGWPPPFAPAVGPELGVALRVAPRVELRVVGLTLSGAVVESEVGKVRLGEQFALAELGVAIWHTPAAGFSLVGGAGVHRIAVAGEARPPYFGERDATVGFVASAGPELGLVASQNARFVVGARAVTVAPDPVVLVFDEAHPMNRLGLLGTLGVELGF